LTFFPDVVLLGISLFKEEVMSSAILGAAFLFVVGLVISALWGFFGPDGSRPDGA